MKNFIKILIIIGISPILSEEYVCSNDLSEFNQSGVEIKAYQRSSEEGFFIRHLKDNKQTYFVVLDETEFYITLVSYSTGSPNLFVTFIDKQNNTFYENFLFYSTHEDLKELMYQNKPSIGTCIVK